MDRFDRIFKLHNILRGRKTPISTAVLKEKLQCSRATVARIVESMRDYLGAPIDYDRNRNGYSYDIENSEHPYELPGLWFSAEELQGLLVCQHLLDKIGPGLLHEQIQHLQSRIESNVSETLRTGLHNPASSSKSCYSSYLHRQLNALFSHSLPVLSIILMISITLLEPWQIPPQNFL
jgi:predicted DNA-binding transcriptional regulator YafY